MGAVGSGPVGPGCSALSSRRADRFESARAKVSARIRSKTDRRFSLQNTDTCLTMPGTPADIGPPHIGKGQQPRGNVSWKRNHAPSFCLVHVFHASPQSKPTCRSMRSTSIPSHVRVLNGLRVGRPTIRQTRLFATDGWLAQTPEHHPSLKAWANGELVCLADLGQGAFEPGNGARMLAPAMAGWGVLPWPFQRAGSGAVYALIADASGRSRIGTVNCDCKATRLTVKCLV